MIFDISGKRIKVVLVGKVRSLWEDFLKLIVYFRIKKNNT